MLYIEYLLTLYGTILYQAVGPYLQQQRKYLLTYVHTYIHLPMYILHTYLGCVVLVISTQKRYCTSNMADFRPYKPEERRTAGMSSHIKAV